MTKADLITVIAEKLKFPWARAELLVDVVFDCMEQSMSRGEKIESRATRPSYPLYPAADRGLELGAEPNLPEWDGNVVGYDWAVGAMIGMG
jgi:Bacterial nucleoid DNA-binding protein